MLSLQFHVFWRSLCSGGLSLDCMLTMIIKNKMMSGCAHEELCGATLVCPKLFFCKQLSLVVYKQDLWTRKTATKLFSVILELKVKNSTILTFKVIFLCQKLAESFWIFLSLKNIKKGDQLLLLKYFDNFDFLCTLLVKMGQIFDLQF